MSGFENSSFEEIGKVIEGKQRFAVVGHARPDGDAIGSTLALGLSLRAHGKSVVMVNADAVPENLRFLPMVDEIVCAADVPKDFAAEAVFIVDSADLERVGKDVLAWIGRETTIINLDHHVSNPGFGDLRYVDSGSPATGQIIFELIKQLELPLGAEAREHLWTAISTDTGSFQYPSTTARTFEIGAELIRSGVDVGAISQELYESYPFRRIEVLRELLNVVEISADGRVASWTLTREVIERFGILPEDTEGLIDVIRSIRGVIVAVFFQEAKGGGVRVSCRSKSSKADVGRMCGKFGGGGHRLAAGAHIPGPTAEAKEKFLNTVYDSLEG